MKLRKLAMSCMVGIPLAACGGSGGPGVSEIDFTPKTLETYLDDGEALVALYRSPIENDEFVSPDTFPTVGTASYLGAMAFSGSAIPPDFDNLVQNSYAISDMTLSVDLAENEIVGTASNFIRLADERVLAGELTLTATLGRNFDVEDDFALIGDITGTLESSDGPVGAVEMEALGDFYGDGGEAIFGLSSGTAAFSETASSADVSATFLLRRSD